MITTHTNEKAPSACNTKGLENYTNKLNSATGWTCGKAELAINSTLHTPSCASIHFGASNTSGIAGNPPDSGIFSRPESFGFGRDGLVRKAGRMAIPMFETSRPPVAHSNVAGGFKSRIGAETMTNVIPLARTRAAESTQSTTSTLDIPRQQAAIENALAMAAHYMRQPRTPESLHAAIGKTSRALTMLKTACTDSQIGGAA